MQTTIEVVGIMLIDWVIKRLMEKAKIRSPKTRGNRRKPTSGERVKEYKRLLRNEQSFSI